MQSNAARAAVFIVAIAVAVMLFVVLKDDDSGDSGTSSTGTTATNETVATTGGTTVPAETPPLVISIQDTGQPVGGVQELSVNKGDDIRFRVNSAIAEEVHLHGYDVSKEVEAGGSVSFDVPADIEGVFEAELEGSATPILELSVNP